MTCDLCGRLFEAQSARATCLSGCGSGKTCAGVRCPYCFYEMIPKPLWLQKFFKSFSRSTEQASETETQKADFGTELPLSKFKMNAKAEVTNLKTSDHGQLKKLISLGVLPGVKLTLLQRFPSFVFQIGFIQFSVDEELASAICVSEI
jgi:Fe2+ transport system protein FeoA